MVAVAPALAAYATPERAKHTHMSGGPRPLLATSPHIAPADRSVGPTLSLLARDPQVASTTGHDRLETSATATRVERPRAGLLIADGRVGAGRTYRLCMRTRVASGHARQALQPASGLSTERLILAIAFVCPSAPGARVLGHEGSRPQPTV
jgi:hypothetical protein